MIMYNADGFCLLTGECAKKECYKNGCDKCRIYQAYHVRRNLMFYNSNCDSNYENESCSVCKNNDICSYLNNREEINSGVEKLKEKILPSSPVGIKVFCKRFEQKNVNGGSTIKTR